MYPLHIYFKKLPVDVHNMEVLSSLPGPLITLKSIDTGFVHNMDSVINSVVTLKVGCKIMLKFNINKDLRKRLPR